MDRGSGALDLAEEPEGEDAHGQADEGDDHPELGNPGQDGVVGHQLRSQWRESSLTVSWKTQCVFSLESLDTSQLTVDCESDLGLPLQFKVQ